MGNLCQHIRTKRSLSQSENITQTDNSIRTSYNPKNEIKNKQSQSVSNALITGKNESIVLGVDYDGNDEGVSMSANTGLPKVILLPHQHTLFCERKVSTSLISRTELNLTHSLAKGLHRSGKMPRTGSSQGNCASLFLC